MRQLLANIKRAPISAALTVFVSTVFLDSLRFKFTNHPNTQEIFGRLNEWAASLGLEGLFAQNGLFSQYVIGTAELIASAMLILSLLLAQLAVLRPIGALMGMGIMTGAISFHLFTPLGVVVNEDGGALFGTAVATWVACLIMVTLNKDILLQRLAELRG